MSMNEPLNYIELPDNPNDWTSSITMPAVQDATNWNIAANIGGTPENREEIEIPQKLKDFRRKWEQEIGLDEDTKRKIIDAVNKIQRGVKEESDWSILVEFELSWWEKYQTLDVNLAEHSHPDYLVENTLESWWMEWDRTTKRKNRDLAEYVDNQSDTRNMKIRTIDFLIDLLNKLWDCAGLTKKSEKIAMWMYLTWNEGDYYWTMKDDSNRYILMCTIPYWWCQFDVDNYPSKLCLISCKKS